MAKRRLSENEQDTIVGDLVTGREKLDEEEYEQVDVDHQMEVDQAVRDYADNAVGSMTWGSDD